MLQKRKTIERKNFICLNKSNKVRNNTRIDGIALANLPILHNALAYS